MKKFSFFVLLLALSLILAACGASPSEGDTAKPTLEPAKEITFYNWSEYIDPQIYTVFEKETGIKVVEDNFSSNEEMLAKLQTGSQHYAVIVPSDYMVTIMIEKNLLSPLTQENVPNLVNLSDKFQNLPYDTGNRYCVPYLWGTTGIGYLEGKAEKPTTWGVFFDETQRAKTAGQMTMLDDARESFATALIYLGYDINTTDSTQLAEAKELLLQAQADLSGYDSERYDDSLAAEENIIAHGWSGDFLMMQEINPNISFTIPREGGVIWVDNLCIPSSATAEEQLAAEMFINFLLRGDIGAMIAEYNQDASPNTAAETLLEEEFLTNPAIYPPKNVLEKLQYIRPLGDEMDAVYQQMWQEVKSGK
jgi:spermidine/putrescine-binding protein